MTQERSDPVIDEVRAVRERISARFGHDPARLVAMELQERHRDRLIDRPMAPEPGDEDGERKGVEEQETRASTEVNEAIR